MTTHIGFLSYSHVNQPVDSRGQVNQSFLVLVDGHSFCRCLFTMALGFNPHELTDMIKNMALPAAKAQAANQTRQAQEEKRAKKLAKEQEKIKSSRGGDVRPSNGLSSSDLPPAPPEFLPTSNGTVEPGYRLIWEDQFNGDTLDSTKWQIESDCRRQELQCYTAKPWNVYVDKGRLFLHAKAHPDGFRPDPTDPCTRSEDCLAIVLLADHARC